MLHYIIFLIKVHVLVSAITGSENTISLNNECGICRLKTDQHLLAKCDTCHLYYHLGCLKPPLTRLPKKSKLYGWYVYTIRNFSFFFLYIK